MNRLERVLVTGAAGFIGRCVVNRLVDDGYLVRALVLHSPMVSSPRARNTPITLSTWQRSRGQPALPSAIGSPPSWVTLS